MKNEVTYDRYECTQANEKSIFGKNMTLNNLFQ